jgi:hypothetical protein
MRTIIGLDFDNAVYYVKEMVWKWIHFLREIFLFFILEDFNIHIALVIMFKNLFGFELYSDKWMQLHVHM